MPSAYAPLPERGPSPAWVVIATLGAKVVLVLVVVQVALDPSWGNLEGKAPTMRAVTYPMLALVVPAVHLVRRRRHGGHRYPWVADLLVTIPGFSDLLGNRWDLYDRIAWFDDVVHLVNTGLLSAGVLLLAGLAGVPLRRRLAVSIAVGTTLSLLWELWEYQAFVAKGSESVSAYADTLGDLSLGWIGTVVAALLVGRGRTAAKADTARTAAPRRSVEQGPPSHRSRD